MDNRKTKTTPLTPARDALALLERLIALTKTNPSLHATIAAANAVVRSSDLDTTNQMHH